MSIHPSENYTQHDSFENFKAYFYSTFPYDMLDKKESVRRHLQDHATQYIQGEGFNDLTTLTARLQKMHVDVLPMFNQVFVKEEGDSYINREKCLLMYKILRDMSNYAYGKDLVSSFDRDGDSIMETEVFDEQLADLLRF